VPFFVSSNEIFAMILPLLNWEGEEGNTDGIRP
jgi:hypothetical protein